MKRFILIEIRSRDYGNQEVPWSDISWRPRKGGGVIQTQSEARELGGWWWKSQSASEHPRTRNRITWGQEMMDVSVQEGTLHLHFVHCFVVFRSSVEDDAHPQWGGPSSLFSLPTQMLICFRKHPHRHWEIMLYQQAGHPLAQTNWCMKLTTTWFYFLKSFALFFFFFFLHSLKCLPTFILSLLVCNI